MTSWSSLIAVAIVTAAASSINPAFAQSNGSSSPLGGKAGVAKYSTEAITRAEAAVSEFYKARARCEKRIKTGDINLETCACEAKAEINTARNELLEKGSHGELPRKIDNQVQAHAILKLLDKCRSNH